MIYLNNAAGTRPAPEVIGVITNVLEEHWGNPHDPTQFGSDAKLLINCVTDQVAKDINCNPQEIVWTSGACEANSLAIDGFIKFNSEAVIVTSKLEHASINHAVYDSFLPETYEVKNDEKGHICLDDLERILRNSKYFEYNDIIVSIAYANSELGVVQDIKSIAEVVHKYNGVLHVDATQAYPWGNIDVQELGIDMMSVSGQKLNAVKGIGFLYVKKGIDLEPIIHGSQQNGLRGGTMPTHLIVGFGAALRRMRDRQEHFNSTVSILTDMMIRSLKDIDGAQLNTIPQLPNVISIRFDGVDAEQLVTMCDLMGVSIGKGSACQSHNKAPSEALMAIGLSEEQAFSTVRISLDTFTTEDEVKEASKIIKAMVNQLTVQN